MTSPRSLVVTGAAGHLGSAVATAALASGWRTTAIVRPEEVSGVPAGCRATAVDWRSVSELSAALASAGECDVVHCAGLGVRAGVAHRELDVLYEANVGIVWRLLSALPDGFAGRVVVVSSAGVYGEHPVVPVSEGAPLDPSRHYASSKVAAEAVATAFHTASGIATVIARPFNIIGAHEPSDSVLGVIADQLDLADEGSDVEVRVREDASVRDFLDIRDVADALMFLACNGRPGTSYNVCSGTGTGIASLVAIAGRAWGVRASSMPTMPEVAGASVSIGDPSALRSLGWSPRRSLEEALYALRTARTGDVTAE